MNRIQGLWIGPELSPIEVLSLQSFLQNGHSFDLYVYEEVKNIPAGVNVCDANTILPKEKIFNSHNGSYAMFADMFRYKMLFDKGGFWVDLDTICLKPFDFTSPTVIATEEKREGGQVVVNGIIKTEQGCQLMEACYNVCLSLDIQDLPWGATGPYLLNELVQKYGLQSYIVPYQTFIPFPWWDLGPLVNPVDNASGIIDGLKDCYAIHLWNNIWSKCNLDKKANYPNSIYEALQHRFGLNL